MIRTSNRSVPSSPLILAALLLSLPLSSCGSGGGKSPLTPTQATMDQGSTSLCQKAAQCSGVTNPSAGDMADCKDTVAAVFTIFPDPAGFESCLTQLSCSSLENDSNSILTCLNLNLPGIQCNADGATLHACTNNGICSDIPCSEVCNYLGGTFAYCGADSARGYDICWCRA